MKYRDAFLVLSRVTMELCAYYNAKYMYSLVGTNLSPTLTTYVGHSLLVLFIAKDLKNYRARLLKDTGYSFKKFFCISFLLTIIFNTSHLPKYYSLNVLSDIKLVACSGLSVIFTDIFSGWTLPNYSRKSKICFLISFVGIALLFLDSRARVQQSFLLLMCILGSASVGIYNVSIKKCFETVKAETPTEILPLKQKRKAAEKKIKKARLSKNRNLKIDFYDLQKKQSENFLSRFGKKIFPENTDTPLRKKLAFLRHYVGMTGAITLVFYWPFLLLSDPHPVFSAKLLLLGALAIIFSVSQNMLYYVLLTSRSPQFVQITGIILQPTIIILEMFLYGFKGFYNTVAFSLVFICFIIL